MSTTVTDLQKQDKLNFSRGRYNILDCGIRTGKTYWAMNNLNQFTRDGKLNRILFLTDTTALKNYLISEYECCVEADDLWIQRNAWGEETPNKIGIMCYQGLGTRFVKGDTDFLKEIDVICWDECDSIFDFAVDAFAIARRTDFARQDVTNAEVLSIIQKYSTNLKYMPLILLGSWEKLINENRIMCIGLSASPQRAYAYYQSLTSVSYRGRIEVQYQIGNDIYFKNLSDHLLALRPEEGHGYWCYSPSIKMNILGVNRVNCQGFCGLELHSEANEDYPMTEEQKRVARVLEETGMIPYPYDFIFVTKAFMRGITIRDPRFDHIIIDSYQLEDRIQAARQVNPYYRHVKVMTEPIPKQYLRTWMTVEECRQLAKTMQLYEKDKNNRSRLITWNGLKEILPTLGYTVESKRRKVNGKIVQCYYIDGEWHDVVESDRGFLQLAEARLEQLKLDK